MLISKCMCTDYFIINYDYFRFGRTLIKLRQCGRIRKFVLDNFEVCLFINTLKHTDYEPINIYQLDQQYNIP